MLELLAPALATGGSRIAILGVTPEIVALPWPAETRLHAVDHSAEMIATVWRSSPAIPSLVTRARWQALPLAACSIDAVVGDGSLNVLSGTDDYADVLAEIARVLRPNAPLVLRCFVRPDRAESLDAVSDALAAGRIGSFHALKWRIAMALATGAGFSVPVAAIRDSFDRLFPDRARLAAATGWPPESIATIDAYRGAAGCYSFPTLAAFAEACAPAFVIKRSARGSYELAERCPTLLLKPKRSA